MNAMHYVKIFAQMDGVPRNISSSEFIMQYDKTDISRVFGTNTRERMATRTRIRIRSPRRLH